MYLAVSKLWQCWPAAALFLFPTLPIILSALQLGQVDLRRAFPLFIVVVNISGVVGVLQLVGCDVTPNYHPVLIRASALLLPMWVGEARGCVA